MYRNVVGVRVVVRVVIVIYNIGTPPAVTTC